MFDGQRTDERQSDRGQTRVIYTCWPWLGGGLFCGVSLVVIGAALVLGVYLPMRSDLIWGFLLMLLGAFVLVWRARGGEM
ncbi:MAG TPA: hypothetical protein QGG47_17170 [Acidobacteriota bacterium]|nr:hypothetical protein [Acidobacteriota bacterium]